MTTRSKPAAARRALLLDILNHGALALVALLFLFPFFWMVSNAVRSNAEVLAIPVRLLPTVIGTGPDARGPQLFQIERRPGFWQVRQVLDDPAGDHGWSIVGVVDLAESDAAGEVVFDELTVSAG